VTIWIGFCFTRHYYSKLKSLAKDKQSSLFVRNVGDEEKSFIIVTTGRVKISVVWTQMEAEWKESGLNKRYFFCCCSAASRDTSERHLAE
jgi:hypothetical protein